MAAAELAEALEQIQHQPTVKMETACCALGISSWLGYQATKENRFPAPTITVGRRILVQSAGLRHLLGLEAEA